MLRRPVRALLGASAILASCATVDPFAPDPSGGEHQALGGVPVRIMTGNLTSGNLQAYEEPGIRIFRGVHPDVALVQEMNYKTNSDADLRAFVDAAFGAEYVYFRETGAQIPNGIVSRYPILASGEWHDTQVSNRDFAWARIDVPGPVDLYAISVHLLSSSASYRQVEAQEIVDQIRASFPADATVVIGGDFNTTARTEAALVTLGQVFDTTGAFPTDQAGNGNTNASRYKPYDWVLATPNLTGRETPVTFGAASFASGLVVDTRVYAPIADLAPALASDSAALNMQHMGVVREFVFPTDEVTPALTVTAPNGGETFAAGGSAQVTFTSTAVDAVKIELTVDGTTWTVLADGVPAQDGGRAVTLPATPTTSARVRVSAAAGTASDVSDAPFTIAAPKTPPRVFLNEVLANEPGSLTSGEFIELLNSGDQPADLSGWTLADAAQVRHVFPAGTAIAGHKALVVSGGAASTGTLSLSNGGDTVTLADGSGQVVDRVAYTSSLTSLDGVSMNRSPDGDPAGAWVLHTTLSAAASSAGTRVDGSAW